MKIAIRCLAMILVLGLSANPAVANGDPIVLGSNADDEGMIFFPAQVDEGPDGNLYVLDSGDSHIKVFSPSGEFLRKFGGQGEGPGEFQRTEGATFGFTRAGRLFFTEFIGGHRWISIMDLTGDLVKVLSPRIGVLFGVQAAVSLDDGGFLVQFRFNSVPRSEGDYYLYDSPRSLVRVDSSGVVVSEIVKAEYTDMISYSPNGGTTDLPHTPRFSWASTGENRVIWSDGMSPGLKVFDYTGLLLREIRTPLPDPVEVSQADLQEWKSKREAQIRDRDPAWWSRFGCVIKENIKPIYDKPVLRSISLTPLGNLLVYGRGNSDSGEFVYWLLDGQGERLLAVDAAAWDVHFSNRFLLWVTFDEEDNPRVHVLKHNGDEIAAMSRLGEIVESLSGSGH